MPFIMLNLSRFSIKELVILIGMLTVCGIVFLVCLVGIFRPARPEVADHVYQLLSTILGLVSGLLGGAAVGYGVAKNGESKNED